MSLRGAATGSAGLWCSPTRAGDSIRLPVEMYTDDGKARMGAHAMEDDRYIEDDEDKIESLTQLKIHMNTGKLSC